MDLRILFTLMDEARQYIIAAILRLLHLATAFLGSSGSYVVYKTIAGEGGKCSIFIIETGYSTICINFHNF